MALRVLAKTIWPPAMRPVVVSQRSPHSIWSVRPASFACVQLIGNVTSPVPAVVSVAPVSDGAVVSTGAGSVADDPLSECNENVQLLRMADGTIRYRAINSAMPPGINAQSVYNGKTGTATVPGTVVVNQAQQDYLVDVTAVEYRTPDRPIEVVWHLRALARRGGEHRVLGRHPASPLPAQPAGDLLLDRRGAQHAGLALRPEHTAVGLLEEVGQDVERAVRHLRAAGRPVPYQVLASTGGTLTIQVTQIGRGGAYTVRVSNPAGADALAGCGDAGAAGARGPARALGRRARRGGGGSRR